ncbi:unnamed protein product [Withania somnifera]
MKVVALVSGGKDSCFSMTKCLQYGHEIVALAYLIPADDATDKLDGYMYQTVGHQIVVSYAKCMGLPLFRRRIQGSTSVCSRLGLVSLAYIWKQDHSFLLQEMIRNGIIAITVKVAAIGVNPSEHLGKEISHLEPHLHKLKDLYGINVCGEGGEYETLTLDCPLFKQGDVQQEGEAATYFVAVSSKQSGVTKRELIVSKTMKDNVFSISCWLENSCKNSSDLQEDLEVVLMRIEAALLVENGSSWENFVYPSLYYLLLKISCRYGAPSRSTIELPLLLVGLGRAYIEVLATLHNDILHMAGQLGLDPATMVLCGGGVPVAELEQELENSEAVARSLNCSISRLAIVCNILFRICRKIKSERIIVQKKTETLLKQMNAHHAEDGKKSIVLDPMFLYVLVPDLPESDLNKQCQSTVHGYWGFKHKTWYDICLQICVAYVKICTAILSFTEELAAKICSLISVSYSGYIPHGTLSQNFSDVFNEFAQINQRIKVDAEPILNIVPVLGAGRSLSTVDDIFTCELIASKC